MQEHKEEDLSRLEERLSTGGREYAGRSDPVLLKRLDDSMAQVGELEYKLEDRDNKIAEQETAIAALNRRVSLLHARPDLQFKN